MPRTTLICLRSRISRGRCLLGQARVVRTMVILAIKVSRSAVAGFRLDRSFNSGQSMPWRRLVVRCWRHVDAHRVELCSRAGDHGAPAKTFNRENRALVPLMEFISTLESCFGVKAELRFPPMQVGDVPATCAGDDALLHWCNFVRPRRSTLAWRNLDYAYYGRRESELAPRDECEWRSSSGPFRMRRSNVKQCVPMNQGGEVGWTASWQF